MKTTGTPGRSSATLAASSRPPMPGIDTSVTSTSIPSGIPLRSSSAPTPFAAAWTSKPSSCRMVVASSRTICSSSTTSARAVAATRRGASAGRSEAARLLGQREMHGEHRPATRPRVEPYEASTLGDRAVDAGQSEPRPFADGLRREERLEDARLRLGAHPLARVGDREERVVTRRERRGRPRPRT